MLKIVIQVEGKKPFEGKVSEGTYRAIMAILTIDSIDILEATENDLIAQFEEEQWIKSWYEEERLNELLEIPRNGKD